MYMHTTCVISLFAQVSHNWHQKAAKCSQALTPNASPAIWSKVQGGASPASALCGLTQACYTAVSGIAVLKRATHSLNTVAPHHLQPAAASSLSVGKMTACAASLNASRQGQNEDVLPASYKQH